MKRYNIKGCRAIRRKKMERKNMCEGRSRGGKEGGGERRKEEEEEDKNQSRGQ